ncbi:MAG: HAD-IA family hydrolase [Spiribacter sp.]|jgi:putative hydrolase of the HAD superfamily|nr:HAD-IA family hydrolase [Spiribacter sp.]MDR9488974.1 HAD-IA family hydrolase [Spiribacter sp.]
MTAKPLLAPVRAVTFDLDFTLWDLTGVLHHAEQVCQGLLEQRYPLVAERYDAKGLQALRNQVAVQQPDIAHDVTALRRAALRAAGEAVGYTGASLESMVEEAFESFLQARHAVHVYDDALPILRALQGRVKVGAITNGNAEIKRLEMGNYFDFSLSAVELGAAKPARLVFATAVNRAGVAAAEIVHVGDDVHSDVFGAAQHGMQAVWLNRNAVAWPEDVPQVPHHEVSNLAELQGMLLGLIGEPS